MEDSIELPASDEDNQQINFFVSPNNSLKKPKLSITHSVSQQSLAYSSQTHAKYHASQRSPMEIKIPNFETNDRPKEMEKMMKAGKQRTQKTQRSPPPLTETKSSDELIKIKRSFIEQEANVPNIIIHREQRKKTINKRQDMNLKKKYKELEYALQVEVISSEELRTKVSILTELLEGKIKDSEYSQILRLKNTSRNLSNIDIFVQLKQNYKKLKECELIMEKQYQQIQSLKDKSLKESNLREFRRIQKQKQNVNTMNYQNQYQISTQSNALQMQALIQEKQSLFNYIEQLRKQYNSKSTYCQQLKNQLQRYQQKQNKFITIQRVKFMQQISQLKSQVKQLQQELQKVKMEANLVSLNYQNQIEQLNDLLQRKMREGEKQKIKHFNSKAVMTETETFYNNFATQTDFKDEEQQLIKAELKLLKKERDYYLQEFKKKVNESSENYLLKLKLKAYENSCINL